MRGRDGHKSAVADFLQKNFPGQGWEITLPPYGAGHETYFARSAGRFYFIKLGIHIERYGAMSSLGLAPQIVLAGHLEDGISIILQQKVDGAAPSRGDFHLRLDQFASGVGTAHRSAALKQTLPPASSEYYRDAGLETLAQVERRWKIYKPLAPGPAPFVDSGIEYLRHEIGQFTGSGLVASHNDICNGNWLVARDGRVYLLDYEAMSLDDPALDLGAILWWYYPPDLRARFLEIAGYEDGEEFRHRMRIRMALHCLHIILPREGSFDRFDAAGFDDSLEDFRAALDGKENPQGYGD